MTDFIQMKTLVLTADLGSLAAVARELKISSAAVSKQLTRLEEELGIQLLIRSTRKIEFTDTGASYLEQCRRILEEVDAASALISQSKVTPSGLLKVFCGRNFGHKFIVPHIKEFLTKYPHIELKLELAERVPDLNLEPLDVVIGMSIPATGDVIQKRIVTTRYVYAASPDYLAIDLKNHRYISHSARKVDEPAYICVNDVEAMLQFALDGMGVIKVHHYAIDDYLKNGKLVEVLKGETDIPIYVAYPNRRFTPSRTRCFIDFFSEKVKNAAEGS